MQTCRIGLIQLAWAGSREAMVTQVEKQVAQAGALGATLVCLPELTLSPYFPGLRDPAGFGWAEPLADGPSAQCFSALARRHAITLVGSLVERTPEGTCYDTATVHAPDGSLIGATRKIHIPSGEGYHETDYFQAGDSYPVVDIGALALATPTCYDQWFPELARIYALGGAELVCYPTAIGAEPGDPTLDSQQAWQTVMRGHAIANGIFVAAVNRVGVENGIRFYGSSFVCDPMGQVLAQAGRDSSEVVFADLDGQTLTRWRQHFPLLHQRRPQAYGPILQTWRGDTRPDWLP
jgi:N-carbamoylputrescine amidase